jgi:hypothetical protein
MANPQELKQKADELKSNYDFFNALPLYRELYGLEKNEWNGYFFAQCLRKTENYAEARQIHTEIKNNYPDFIPIKNEELWLDYSEKIKDRRNINLLHDAEEILTKTDKYDIYTGSIYTKTVLSVVKHLINIQNNLSALDWLNKLDFTVLSKDPFNYRGSIYPSNQKEFFIRYADVLINLHKHNNYIDSCLSILGFHGGKFIQFKNKIIDEITFSGYLSRVKLALFLKYFKDEIYFRSKNLFEKKYSN